MLQVGGANLVAMTRCSPELVAPATTYLRIRALSAPTVLLLMVAQVQNPHDTQEKSAQWEKS